MARKNRRGGKTEKEMEVGKRGDGREVEVRKRAARTKCSLKGVTREG